MKDFAVNILIILLIMLAYYLDVFNMFTSEHALWVVGGIIILLFAIALKILGNPFAKDDDDD